MLQLPSEGQKPPKERNSMRKTDGFGTREKGRGKNVRGSSHLFVGVKLFVCLMPEPAMKPGRNVRSGKKIRIIVIPQTFHFPPFQL